MACTAVSQVVAPEPTASLDRMQNSLPSGSPSVIQPLPSDRRWSANCDAPSARIRSVSCSRVRSAGRRSRWTRFFTILLPGTVMKSKSWLRSRDMIRHSWCPGSFGSSGSSMKSRTCDQKTDCAWASRASNEVCGMRLVMAALLIARAEPSNGFRGGETGRPAWSQHEVTVSRSNNPCTHLPPCGRRKDGGSGSSDDRILMYSRVGCKPRARTWDQGVAILPSGPSQSFSDFSQFLAIAVGQVLLEERAIRILVCGHEPAVEPAAAGCIPGPLSLHARRGQEHQERLLRFPQAQRGVQLAVRFQHDVDGPC